MSNTLATHEQHISNTLATHEQHISNTLATHSQRISNTLATHWQHLVVRNIRVFLYSYYRMGRSQGLWSSEPNVLLMCC